METLYPGYKLLFMFENAISYAIYAKDALQIAYIKKELGRQQLFLRLGWYKTTDGKIII